MWMRNPKFKGFQSMYSIVIGMEELELDAIFKKEKDRIFHRIRYTDNLLRKIRILILDENYCETLFPKFTQVNLILVVKPSNMNI